MTSCSGSLCYCPCLLTVCMILILCNHSRPLIQVATWLGQVYSFRISQTSKANPIFGAFRRDNVRVIIDMGLLVFRELTEDTGGKWLSNLAAVYNEYHIMLKIAA